LSGLAYLIYDDHKRRNNGAKRQQGPAELENSGTAAAQVDSFNSDL
jgi:hypothetical protein